LAERNGIDILSAQKAALAAVERVKSSPEVTFKDAIEAFLDDCFVRKLRKPTLLHYSGMLSNFSRGRENLSVRADKEIV
jgi:hypothetical protein